MHNSPFMPNENTAGFYAKDILNHGGSHILLDKSRLETKNFHNSSITFSFDRIFTKRKHILEPQTLNKYDIKFNRDIKFIRIFTYLYNFCISYQLYNKRKTIRSEFVTAIPYSPWDASSFHSAIISYNGLHYPQSLRKRKYVKIFMSFKSKRIGRKIKIKHEGECEDEFLRTAKNILKRHKGKLEAAHLADLLQKSYKQGLKKKENS